MESEEAERIWGDRRQRCARDCEMNGGPRNSGDTWRRASLLYGSPRHGGRIGEIDLLTLHAAIYCLGDALAGTGIHTNAVETLYRKSRSFLAFDRKHRRRELLIMAKSGGGKTFMSNSPAHDGAPTHKSPLSNGVILKAAWELMRGSSLKLDAPETLNLGNLPSGETAPSKEKIAFLKSHAHMIRRQSRLG